MFKYIIGILIILLCFYNFALAADWYARPFGGDYGAEDGTSYENAWDGLTFVVWGPGGVESGDTLYVSGIHIHQTDALPGSYSSEAQVFMIGGEGENSRITVRGDASSINPSYLDGIVWGAHRKTVGDSWTPTVGEPGVYEYIVKTKLYKDWIFEVNNLLIDSFTVLERKANVAEVTATPGSFYLTGTGLGDTIYVHMTDSGDPEGRVLLSRWGYKFWIPETDSYVTFKNLTFYNPRNILGGSRTHIRFEGNKFLYGELNMFALTDGSDYIEIIDNDIGWATNGIYNISSTNNSPSYYNFSGNYIHDIGVRPSQQNEDNHAIGIQGGHDGVIDGNFIERTGTGPLLYAYAYQILKNVVISGNYIRNLHNYGRVARYGIATQQDSLAHADKSGIKYYYNIVDGAYVCYRATYEDEMQIYNNVGIDCETGLEAVKNPLAIFFNSGISDIQWKDVLIGATSGAAARVNGVRSEGSTPEITGSFSINTNIARIDFISGGPAEILVPTSIEGDISESVNTVRYVQLADDSESWATGNAEGFVAINYSVGNFINNETFSIIEGQNDIFTMVGNKHPNIFQVGETLLRDEIPVATFIEVVRIGPSIKARNNIFLNSERRHVTFSTSSELHAVLDLDYNLYYPDGLEMFSVSGFGLTDLAGFQSESHVNWVLDPNSFIADPLITGIYPAGNSPAWGAGEDQGNDFLLPACEAEFKTGAIPGYFPKLNPDRWGWPIGFCINIPLSTTSGL